MAQHNSLSAISNPLISSKQLISHQQRNSSSPNLDTTIFRISLLTQSAGVLLRLPQEVIATSIIILQRYLTTNGTVLFEDTNDKETNFDPDTYLTRASSAAIYLSAKQSFYPLSPRSIVNVYALLTSPSNPLDHHRESTATQPPDQPDPKAYYVSEGTYQSRRDYLYTTERDILTSLAFDTKVVLPYNLALTYLQALAATSSTLSERVLAHLNAALLSPQLLYLTHQPHTVAVAAIYLAAREQGVALVDEEVPWWEVFDVGREELGFLVLSLGSLEGFVREYRGLEDS